MNAGTKGQLPSSQPRCTSTPRTRTPCESDAEYLLSRRDYRGALPVLRRLIPLAKKPDDVRNLMRAFIEIGDAEEALTLQASSGGRVARPPNISTPWQGPATSAMLPKRPAGFTGRPRIREFSRKYLDILSRYDMPASLAAYATHTHDGTDCDILFDYILLLKSNGDYARALDEAEILLSRSQDPVYLSVRADLLAALGRHDGALASYEQLIHDELGSKNDLDTLGLVIGKYRRYLMTRSACRFRDRTVPFPCVPGRQRGKPPRNRPPL